MEKKNTLSGKGDLAIVLVVFRSFRRSESELARSFNPLFSSSFISKICSQKCNIMLNEKCALHHLQKSSEILSIVPYVDNHKVLQNKSCTSDKQPTR